MVKYAQIKKFHRECRLQVYMYSFMYVDPEAILEDYRFPATRFFSKNTRTFKLHYQCQNIGLNLVTSVYNIMS